MTPPCQGVGLDGLQRSLLTLEVLRFCDTLPFYYGFPSLPYLSFQLIHVKMFWKWEWGFLQWQLLWEEAKGLPPVLGTGAVPHNSAAEPPQTKAEPLCGASVKTYC